MKATNIARLSPVRQAILAASKNSLKRPAAMARRKHLFPLPYPELLGPNPRIGGTLPMTAAQGHLLPDPVPPSLAPSALGNPRPWYRHRHQQLLQRLTDGNISLALAAATIAASLRETGA
jgi:hypothetical protein